MSTAVFRVSVRGARKPGFALSRAGRTIQKTLLDEFQWDVSPLLTRTARAYAPHRSGRLDRGLNVGVRSAGGRITATLYSDAVSDEGFAYTDVTRFGHRVAFIYPVHAKALRIPQVDGGVHFARRVKGYRPAGDWVDRAEGAIDANLTRVEDKIGRQLVSRLL